ARFVGTPYKLSPLGEGPGAPLDPDPTFDLRHVDCLTLVEEVLALAHNPDLSRAKALLQRIRYDDGVVDFAHRRHFAMTQWIPGKQRLGVLRDVTAEVGARVVQARKTLGPHTWRGKWAVWPKRLADRLPRGEFALPVIPIDEAIAASERIPDGAFVSVVRTDRPRTPIRITHQGIVVVKHGRR